MVAIVFRGLDGLPVQKGKRWSWAVDAHAGGALRPDRYGCITVIDEDVG